MNYRACQEETRLLQDLNQHLVMNAKDWERELRNATEMLQKAEEEYRWLYYMFAVLYACIPLSMCVCVCYCMMFNSLVDKMTLNMVYLNVKYSNIVLTLLFTCIYYTLDCYIIHTYLLFYYIYCRMHVSVLERKVLSLMSKL